MNLSILLLAALACYVSATASLNGKSRVSRTLACLTAIALLTAILVAPAAAQQPSPQPVVVAAGAPQPVYAAPLRRGLHWMFAPRAWAQPTLAVFPAPPQPPQAVYCPTCRQYHVRR